MAGDERGLGEEARIDGDDPVSNVGGGESIGDILLARFSRRQALRGLTAVAAVAALGGAGVPWRRALAAGVSGVPSSLAFKEVVHGESESHVVAEGYAAQTLIRWGDPLFKDAPAFDPLAQSAAAQSRQWGYNNDFLAFLPLPRDGESADHGLLCANFEYTDFQLMFPGLKAGDVAAVSREQCEIELAAHGHGVVEVRRDDATNRWRVVLDSPYNRRITALATECEISGPAAGHERLKTSADPTGRRVIGTLNNCAGGKTPWGTVLICEENFHQYFAGATDSAPQAKAYKRYGIRAASDYAWSRFFDRFDVGREPNEPNRFGWVVEIDPYDAAKAPIKRTALGRFKHEGATCVVNGDGRVVIYSGDDERFEYIYKYVSRGRFDPAAGTANGALLDDGTLYVAKFAADGTLAWLPLVFGQGPLTSENGFAGPGDVLIETRRAADLVGATPMDRPEDVETNPKTGLVYAVLTNNASRKADRADPANPRGPNPHGHILELIPPGGAGARDHAASVYGWELFLLAGDPGKAEEGSRYHPKVSADGWLSSPDNVTFDRQGRMWIATDGLPRSGLADGAYAVDTQGPGRALTRHFYRTPVGAELCGPEFNPDDTALFVAVQHPGDTKGSTFDAPATRWPDFRPDVPPRPSVQVIIKTDKGPIGG